MRGEVLTYDDGPGTGLISGDDGVRYAFARADMQQLAPVRAGARVDFVPVDGRATQVFLTGPVGVAGGHSTETSIDWRRLLFQADGRIGQKDYWVGFGITFLASLLLSWIPLVGVVVTILVIFCGVCVSSKRLHDMGRSGWLAAVPYGLYAAAAILSSLTLIGGLAGAGFDSGLGLAAGFGMMGLLWTLAFLANIAFVIWLGITPGQPGDNIYGPPPQPLARF